MGAGRPNDPGPDMPPPALYRMGRAGRRAGPPLPPPRRSARLLLRLTPEHIALFRFLLEAYDNLAYFTVLERRTAPLKLVFSPQRERAVRRALSEMARSLPFTAEDWPLPDLSLPPRPADRA